MIFLILSIILSSSLVLLFKWYGKFNLDTLQILVSNYWTCVICATIYTGSFPLKPSLVHQDWFLFTIMMGFFFITGFYSAAKTIEIAGVSVTSVMQKMSLLILVAYTTYFYHESLNFVKILGLIAAIGAIFLSASGGSSLENRKHKNWLAIFFPIATLVLGGGVDICIFEVQKSFPQLSGDAGFIGVLFGIAGIMGIIILIFRYIIYKKKLDSKSWLAGILLGIPNFFSIVTLLAALNIGWEGSVVFPINNVGVIAFATIVAWLLLGEKINSKKIASILLSILAILLIALS